jgi:hypothetical protein
LAARARVPERERKGFDARVMITCMSLWKRRNARVFSNVTLQCTASELVVRIREELAMWSLARVNQVSGGSLDRPGE